MGGEILKGELDYILQYHVLSSCLHCSGYIVFCFISRMQYMLLRQSRTDVTKARRAQASGAKEKKSDEAVRMERSKPIKPPDGVNCMGIM